MVNALKWGFLLILAWLSVLPCLADAPLKDDTPAILTLSGPAVPYQRVEFRFEKQSDLVTLTVIKQHASPFGAQDGMALLMEEEWNEIVQQLQEVWSFKQSQKKNALWRWSLTFRGQTRHWDEPELTIEGLGERLQKLQRWCEERVPIPFEDQLLLPEESGRLRVLTWPKARVFVDGIGFGETPVVRWMETGTHQIHLENTENDSKLDLEAQVEKGRWTNLEIDLK